MTTSSQTWPTLVQCREETPFKPIVQSYPHPEKGMIPQIICPTCDRSYFLKDDGTWFSDRSLKILDTPE